MSEKAIKIKVSVEDGGAGKLRVIETVSGVDESKKAKIIALAQSGELALADGKLDLGEGIFLVYQASQIFGK